MPFMVRQIIMIGKPLCRLQHGIRMGMIPSIPDDCSGCMILGAVNS